MRSTPAPSFTRGGSSLTRASAPRTRRHRGQSRGDFGRLRTRATLLGKLHRQAPARPLSPSRSHTSSVSHTARYGSKFEPCFIRSQCIEPAAKRDDRGAELSPACARRPRPGAQRAARRETRKRHRGCHCEQTRCDPPSATPLPHAAAGPAPGWPTHGRDGTRGPPRRAAGCRESAVRDGLRPHPPSARSERRRAARLARLGERVVHRERAGLVRRTLPRSTNRRDESANGVSEKRLFIRGCGPCERRQTLKPVRRVAKLNAWPSAARRGQVLHDAQREELRHATITAVRAPCTAPLLDRVPKTPKGSCSPRAPRDARTRGMQAIRQRGFKEPGERLGALLRPPGYLRRFSSRSANHRQADPSAPKCAPRSRHKLDSRKRSQKVLTSGASSLKNWPKG